MDQCQRKCRCGKACGQINIHDEHECQECDYHRYWDEQKRIDVEKEEAVIRNQIYSREKL